MNNPNENIISFVQQLETFYKPGTKFLRVIQRGQECFCVAGAMVDFWSKQVNKKVYWDRKMNSSGIFYYLNSDYEIIQARRYLGLSETQLTALIYINDSTGEYPISKLKEYANA